MATFEHSGLFSYKDENKDIHLLYPVTKKDNVEGMDVVEQNVSTAQQTADNALTAANTATAARTTARIICINRRPGRNQRRPGYRRVISRRRRGGTAAAKNIHCSRHFLD